MNNNTLGITIVELEGYTKDTAQLSEIVMNHSLGASLAAAGSAWATGAGPAIATTLSAGFVFSMMYRINEKLGIKLSKEETKKVANSILHAVVPTVTAPLIASTLLSFIPILGNAASLLIMSGVCYSATFTAGVIYLKVLAELKKKGTEAFSASELERVAIVIIHDVDMNSIIKEANEIYAAEKEKGVKESPVTVVDDEQK